MAGKSTLGETFLVYGEYPHNLMQHLLMLLRVEKKKEDWLATEEFLKSFLAKFPDAAGEQREIRAADEKGVLRGFVEYQKKDEAQKKRFIQNALETLVGELREYEAVELMESLMWVFGWEIAVEVTRKWEVSAEDKANFHSYDELDLYEKKKKTEAEKQREEVEKREEKKSSQEQKTSKKQEKKEREKREVKKETEKVTTVAEKATIDKKSFFKMILGMDLLEEEKYRKILQEMRVEHENQMHLSMRKEIKRAKRGNDISQTNLADFYAEENTEHTDYFAAAMWYSFAARQGNDRARLELAKLIDGKKLLDEGEKVNQMRRYATLYFKELAEKGFPAAQGILGMKYYLGDGVRKNSAKGISWLKQAAEQGQVEAQKQLGEIYSEIDEAESQKWFRLAGAAGDVWAKTRIK